tara:strand:+ start:351 stop:806 length:456 start_codon:yes stop_codon:yes gene_type:complete
MAITYHSGEDAPRFGARIIRDDPQAHGYQMIDSSGCWSYKASSMKIAKLFEIEAHKGRRHWAQLMIHLDGVSLAFWLPEELDHICDVFSMKPFPTANTLIRNETDEARNSHWLSRLPKKAKSTKFRLKFLKFVNACPNELNEFRRHYRISQ